MWSQKFLLYMCIFEANFGLECQSPLAIAKATKLDDDQVENLTKQNLNEISSLSGGSNRMSSSKYSVKRSFNEAMTQESDKTVNYDFQSLSSQTTLNKKRRRSINIPNLLLKNVPTCITYGDIKRYLQKLVPESIQEIKVMIPICYESCLVFNSDPTLCSLIIHCPSPRVANQILDGISHPSIPNVGRMVIEGLEGDLVELYDKDGLDHHVLSSRQWTSFQLVPLDKSTIEDWIFPPSTSSITSSSVSSSSSSSGGFGLRREGVTYDQLVHSLLLISIPFSSLSIPHHHHHHQTATIHTLFSSHLPSLLLLHTISSPLLSSSYCLLTTSIDDEEEKNKESNETTNRRSGDEMMFQYRFQDLLKLQSLTNKLTKFINDNPSIQLQEKEEEESVMVVGLSQDVQDLIQEWSNLYQSTHLTHQLLSSKPSPQLQDGHHHFKETKDLLMGWLEGMMNEMDGRVTSLSLLQSTSHPPPPTLIKQVNVKKETFISFGSSLPQF